MTGDHALGAVLVTTGFSDLDRVLALEAGSLVVIGARSGRGKSALATQLAIHVAQKWGNAIYFSSEMPSEQLALRAACMIARVDSRRVRRGLCNADEGHKLARHEPAVDVYRVLRAFDVTDQAICHALKKLLAAGKRNGGKPIEQDVREAIWSLKRWLEMQDEEQDSSSVGSENDDQTSRPRKRSPGKSCQAVTGGGRR